MSKTVRPRNYKAIDLLNAACVAYQEGDHKTAAGFFEMANARPEIHVAIAFLEEANAVVFPDEETAGDEDGEEVGEASFLHALEEASKKRKRSKSKKEDEEEEEEMDGQQDKDEEEEESNADEDESEEASEEETESEESEASEEDELASLLATLSEQEEAAGDEEEDENLNSNLEVLG